MIFHSVDVYRSPRPRLQFEQAGTTFDEVLLWSQ